MTNELSDLAHNVRVLKLEVQKLELNNRIAQLKAEPTIDEECVGCCKVVDVAANLQHELDELKTDCDWWRQSALNTEKSRVLTSNKLGEYKETIRVERIDRAAEKTMINRKFSEDLRKNNTIIDELKDRVAFDAKHTDRLNKVITSHIHEIRDLKKDNYEKDVALTGYQMQSDEMHKEIEELKDKNIDDLKELYDLCEEELRRLKYVISARDLTIKSLTTMCQSSGTERNRLASTIEDLEHEIKVLKKTIKLDVTDIEGLEAELNAWKCGSKMLLKVPTSEHIHPIIDEIVRRTNHNMNVEVDFWVPESSDDDDFKGKFVEQAQLNGVLLGQISDLKHDSEVLLEVVDTIRCWESTPIGGLAAVTEIKDIIDDYLDAPEGPEDTPIDEPQEVTVTFAWLELP